MADFKNVRVQVVHREGERDWCGCGRYLSIRAYRGRQYGKSIFMGPDIPIETAMPDSEVERVAILLLGAICGEDTAAWQAERDTAA